MLGQTGVCLRVLLAIGSGVLAALSILTASSFAERLAAEQPAVSRVSNRTRVASQTLFDDFNYLSSKQLARHGWIIRTAAGWPGVPGAMWGNSGVSFSADPDRGGNRLFRMTSSTDGTGPHNHPNQILH